MKLPKIQVKAFEQMLKIMELVSYEDLPPKTIATLNQYGIVKEENETMVEYVNKIRKFASEKNGMVFKK